MFVAQAELLLSPKATHPGKNEENQKDAFLELMKDDQAACHVLVGEAKGDKRWLCHHLSQKSDSSQPCLH